ncbi:1-acyl-sn-glycerol-3-phosphate acyltransferase [Roseovarius spongiae]|uniref:1-acyl-sn-glycerol-3-phosphate acyltransferase n=1 Tax=Roseovarius spongiae TaxID=2320272 RepID=A0A3A8AYG9_9RHOB|nr:lysophospholipid acyltransferase family protein [Roseovarius spongiae]RKF17027.1 1-acyl-sn-glycerol-3-phosphate acyltransferase [Roseovarius spongiae]
MSAGWTGTDDPVAPPITAAGWLRAVLRAALIVPLFLGGLLLLLLIRLVERPLCGLRRPVTPFIVQGVFRGALALLQIRVVTTGAPMTQAGAVVANHASWLDILVLNIRKRVYFVSKAEVARWPLIGFMARAVGTVFISRNPGEARAQTALFEQRLLAGHPLLFFPEGTSSDGLRVLPFKSTLFAAFLTPALREALHVQPVTLRYVAPEGQDARFYGWWGDMDFGPHALMVLAASPQGRVELHYHTPVRVADFADRKALARHVEQVVRSGFAALSAHRGDEAQ